MKYIIISDLSYIFSKKNKFLLAYIFLYIFYFYMIKNLYLETKIFDFLNNVLAIKFNFNILINDPFNACMLILNIIFYIYLSLIIYKKDVDNFDNFFFRMNVKKWIIAKLIVIFSLIVIFNFIIFINVYLNGIIKEIIMFLLLKKILLLMIFITIIYIALLFFNKIKILSILIIILLISYILIGFNIKNMTFWFLLFNLSICFSLLMISSHIINFNDLKG